MITFSIIHISVQPTHMQQQSCKHGLMEKLMNSPEMNEIEK